MRRLEVEYEQKKNVLSYEKEIYNNLKVLDDITNSKDKLAIILDESANKLKAEQVEYNKKETNLLSALEVLTEKYNIYNEKVDDSTKIYEELKAKRLLQRKAQEKYDWATSIYLKDMGENTSETYKSPKEKESEIKYNKERAEKTLLVLEELKSGSSNKIEDVEYNRSEEHTSEVQSHSEHSNSFICLIQHKST